MKLLHCLLAATLATTWCAAFPQDVSHPPTFSGFKAPLLFPNLARPWQGYQRTSDFGISPVKDLGYPPHNEFEYPPVNGFNEFGGLPETNFQSSDLQEREVPDEVSPESLNAYNTENAIQVNSENVPNPFMFEDPHYSRIPETIPDFPNHNFNNFPIPYALEYMESLATRTPRFPFPYIPEFPVPASPPSPIIPNFLVGIPEHLTPKELLLNNIPGFPVPNTREFQFDAVQRFPALNSQEFLHTVPSNVPEFPFWNFPGFPSVPVVHASAFGLSPPNVPDFTLPKESGFPFGNTPGINRMNIPEFLVPNVPDYNVPNSPEFFVPNFEIPNVPEIPVSNAAIPYVPDFNGPAVPNFAVPNVPDFNGPAVPNFAVPNVPDFNGPAVPNFSVPNVPDFTGPAISNVPFFSGPAVPNFAVPTVPDFNSLVVPNVPDFNGPAVPNFAVPNVPDFTGQANFDVPNVPDFTGPAVLNFPNALDFNGAAVPYVPDFDGLAVPNFAVPNVPHSAVQNGHATQTGEEIKPSEQLLLLDLELQKTHNAPRSPLVTPFTFHPFDTNSQVAFIHPFDTNSQVPPINPFDFNSQVIPFNPFVNNDNHLPPTAINPFMMNSQSPIPFMINNQSPYPFMMNSQSPSPFMISNQSPNPFMNSQSPNPFMVSNESPSPLMINMNQSPAPFTTNFQSPSPLMTNQSPNPFMTNNQSPLILDTFAPPINPFVLQKMQDSPPVFGGPQIFDSIPLRPQSADGFETESSEPQLTNGPIHVNAVVNPHASEAFEAPDLQNAVAGRGIDVANRKIFNEEMEKIRGYNPVPATPPITRMEVVKGPYNHLDFDGSYNSIEKPVPFFY